MSLLLLPTPARQRPRREIQERGDIHLHGVLPLFIGMPFQLRRVSLTPAEASAETFASLSPSSSESYMPSLSLLLGPMLAARMCVTAHSRARLARLPAGTIQILGAEQAFFEHLKHGSAPPKHGHLFMHPWVGKSPRWVRGKIARMLAGKVCLAVRSDHFGGQTWDEKHVQEIKSKVESLIKNHPRPPKR